MKGINIDKIDKYYFNSLDSDIDNYPRVIYDSIKCYPSNTFINKNQTIKERIIILLDSIRAYPDDLGEYNECKLELLEIIVNLDINNIIM
jgi:hypothetical protein